MTGTVFTRPSQVTVWVDPPLLCLDVLVVESTPRLLTWVLTLWARLRRTFLRMTHVTLPPLLVSPCTKNKLSIMDCLIVQLRVPEHWHHMLLRLLMVQAVMFLCPKTALCLTCKLGRLICSVASGHHVLDLLSCDRVAFSSVIWGIAHYRHAPAAQCLASHRPLMLQTSLATLHTLTTHKLYNTWLINMCSCCRQCR